MANEHEYDKDLGQTKRISPFVQEELYDGDDAAKGHETSESQSGYAYDAGEAAYDDVYEDEYGTYDDEVYSDEEYDDESYDDDEYEQQPGFFSTLMGKVIVGVIALLVVVLVALLVVRFTSTPKDQKLPSEQETKLPAAVEETKVPGSIVFAPSMMETPKPTEAPTPAPTKAPTAEPKPTDSPLPIIMTNTPTPSPSPTVSPSPSPSPTPVPTSTPEPTPVPEIGTGEVNRDAKLRQSVAGSVKSTIKKGERVTVHESILDQDSKIWYALTVDDLETTGWMRDYVVDLDKKIAKPTHTPDLTATPEPEKEEPEKSETTPEPTAAPDPDVIGTGRTTKEANVRKIMNGKVLVQLRKNKKVEILSAKVDKNDKLWYEVRPEGSSTVGFVRDYLIKLDEGVKIAAPTATPKLEETPAPEAEENEDVQDSAEQEKQEESILDREIIGKAKTKKPANIRVKPASGAKLVRQLSKGIELMVLEKYQDEDGNIWYEVCTESGRTQGFARDYLLDFSEIDKDREALTYGKE